MKKSLLALAVLGAFAGAAQAQSAVTLYGTIDGGVRYKNNVNAAGDSLWAANTGTYYSNRIGFKGVEDLGGGLNAHFVLEGGYNSKTGASGVAGSLFDRGASVGIGGGWGSLDLGLQYSVAFKTVAAYDPFSYHYTPIIPLAGEVAGNQVTTTTSAIGSTRFQNDIQYVGNFGPVAVRAEYALGEQAGSTGNGSAQAVGAVYSANGVTLGSAYTRRKPNVGTTAAPNFQSNTQWTIGGAYAAGPFRVAAGYMNEKQDFTVGDGTKKNAWVGGSYAVSPAWELTAGYYDTKLSGTGVDTRRKLFIVGSAYSLSKRTTIYADIDRANFSGSTTFGTGTSAGTVSPLLAQPAGQTGQTGVSVGIQHAF
jgi:predicted porin